MSVLPVKRRRTSKWAYAALAILVGLGLLMWGLCTPLDVSADAARYGTDYRVGSLYVLLRPAVRNKSGYILKAGLLLPEPSDIPLPTGTRIRVTRILLLRGMYVDNVPRVQAYGEVLGGAAPTHDGTLWGISRIGFTPGGTKATMIDPEMLQPVP